MSEKEHVDELMNQRIDNVNLSVGHGISDRVAALPRLQELEAENTSLRKEVERLQSQSKEWHDLWQKASDSANAMAKDAERYKRALESIKSHQEIVLPNGHEMSAIWMITDKALSGLEGRG